MSIFGYSKLSVDQAKLFIINSYIGVLRRYPEREILENFSYQISSGKKTCAEFLSGLVQSKEFQNISGSVDFFDSSKVHPEFLIENYKDNSRKGITNIVYLGFSVNRPIGGMKVIFHHVNLINSIKEFNISAEVFFPEAQNFKITWLDIEIPIKRNSSFNASADLVVIPEVWAWYYGSYFLSHGIKYAIFVQNGYLLYHELSGLDRKKLAELRKVYKFSENILTISDDTTACIKSIYSDLEHKIIQLTASIDTDLFFQKNHKNNLITYMPRKLPSHSSWVTSSLLEKIPENWQIIPIDNMSEKEVAEILKDSKIFLSFSDQEGLGLPPLEAALAGNKVIGYTGEAGEEYWSGDIFHKIECGNLLAFVDVVVEEIKKLDKLAPSDVYPEFSKQVMFLAEKYSIQVEKEKLKFFLRELDLKQDYS